MRAASSELRRLALGVVMPGFVGTTVPEWLRGASADGLAGVCLFGQNAEDVAQVRALTDELHAARPELLVAADEEGGTVSRLDSSRGSPWPAAAALGALDEVDATRTVAQALGGRAAVAGIDLVLAPVLDVNSDPDNPVIGVRSFGADPELVGRHGVAFTEGLAQAGVLGCGKHFPGHGDTHTDSHVGLPRVEVDAARWRARDLPPFAAAIRAGLPAIMTAHVVLSGLDDRPATISAPVLRVLRDELGFTGVIVSDALDMKAISAGIGKPAGAVQALAAGVDLVCIGNPAFPEPYDDAAALEEIVSAVVSAVEDGTLTEARLVEAGQRVAAAGTSRPDVPVPAARTRDDLVRAAVPIAAAGLTVSGDVTLGEQAVVWAPPPVVGYAAGRTDSALVAELRRRRPDWQIVESADPAALASGADLAVVVEGALDQRRRESVAAVLAEVPDAVIVYGGLARDDDAGRRTIHTHGSSAATALAVADLLTGAAR